jgi:two-component system, chemotaxis family, chemotaxis protein CheY
MATSPGRKRHGLAAQSILSEVTVLPQVVRHPGFDFSELRAIVVEDNDTNRIIISRILRYLKCAVVETAKNGDEALTMILSSPHGYDLIVSDYEMPEMNGLQLLKQVRVGTAGVNRDIGFIMLTGHADSFIVGSAFNLDVDSFVVKPVTPSTLKARITRVMSARGLIKKPVDYRDIEIDPNRIGKPKVEPEITFAPPPWESEDTDTAGIVKRELSQVIPGSKLANDLSDASGQLLLPSGQTLDENTLDRLRNLSELDGTVTRLLVREVAR